MIVMTMSEKRFVEDYSYLVNYDKYCILDKVQHKHLYLDEVIDLLNESYEEKKNWKNNYLKTVNENSILWNEISILQEQGAEPSNAFKNYINSLKNKIKKLQEDLE